MQSKLRLLHALADELQFTRDERHELAEHALNRDVTTWSTLTEPEVDRLLDNLMGYIRVKHLLEQRVVPFTDPPDSLV